MKNTWSFHSGCETSEGIFSCKHKPCPAFELPNDFNAEHFPEKETKTLEFNDSLMTVIPCLLLLAYDGCVAVCEDSSGHQDLVDRRQLRVS